MMIGHVREGVVEMIGWCVSGCVRGMSGYERECERVCVREE